MVAVNRKAVLCSLAICAVAFCGDARQLQSTTQCNTAAFLEIFVTAGTCSGTATASCEAQSQAQNGYDIAIEEWFKDGGVCDVVKREAAAAAVGKAVASVYADAVVSAECSTNAQGVACGWSVGSGEAFAVATAKAVALAAAEVGGDAICESIITAQSAVLAEAAASAGAAVCLEGPGQKQDYEDEYVVDVQFALAEAFAKATAYFCDSGSLSFAKAECEGSASASNSGSDVQTCESLNQNGNAKCCSSSYSRERTFCTCNGCSGGVWHIVDAGSSTNPRVWKDGDDTPCQCT